MSKMNPTTDDIAKVEAELWNAIRALDAIETLAVSIASKSAGEINALGEAIAGSAVVTASHIRRQQIALGGSE